jgi:Protein of unknown function (DUF2950)
MMNQNMNRQILAAVAVAVMALCASPVVLADAVEDKVVAAKAKTVTQRLYASPEEAAKALYDAVKSQDVKLVYAVLGPGSDKLIYTGDAIADQQMRQRFLDAYDKSLKVERDGDKKAILLLGENESPFPFPLVKGSKGWTFDAKAGAEEIINRRVGENELFAIKSCLAYGDAQQEYAEVDRDGDRLIEYAQKFRSSEGKRDGLFWLTAEGEPLSPLGPLAAQVRSEGYSAKSANPAPLHGYYYRILTAQGKDAPGGAYDYLVKGNLIGGYALVAYPARWGASGVMTFICNHDGVVYQQNLGEKTAEIASKITRFNPDASWQKAE